MRINCEYCGFSFDSDEHGTCPSCGASTSGNFLLENERKQKGILTDYEKLKLEEQARKEKLENDKREQALELDKQTAQVSKVLKIGCLIPFILFVAGIIIVIILAFVTSIKDNFVDNGSSSDKENDTEIVEVVETPVTVGFNEIASTSKYSIICDSYEVVDSFPFACDDGYQCVKFHFIFENLSDDYVNFSKIKMHCISYGLACESHWKNGVKGIPGSLDKGLKTDGNEVFEVPINANEFEIKYGDYITIKFENTLEKQ